MAWPGQQDPSTYYQSLTADQQLANWQQWQNYQQQYAAWHAQYGVEYAKQVQSMSSITVPISTNYTYPGGMQPPLPPTAPIVTDVDVSQSRMDFTYSTNSFGTQQKMKQNKSNHVTKNVGNHFNQFQQTSSHKNHKELEQYKNVEGIESSFKSEGCRPSKMCDSSTKNDHYNKGNYKTLNTKINVESTKNQIINKRNEDLNSLTEEEKQFEEQFKQWEREFEKWKKQNVDHPDRKAYDDYEKKFEECRTKLLMRREQMRKRKLNLLNIKKEPDTSIDCDEDLNNLRKENSISNMENVFNSNATSVGIPGLDLNEAENNEDNSTQNCSTLNLTEYIEKSEKTSTVSDSIAKLIENPMVHDFLSKLGLNKGNITSSQKDALKPIIDVLSRITKKNHNVIIEELLKASIELKTSKLVQNESLIDNDIHVAQSGIIVAPQTVEYQSNSYQQYTSTHSHDDDDDDYYSNRNKVDNVHSEIDSSAAYFQPTTVIDYSPDLNRNDFNFVNVVDYQHGEIKANSQRAFTDRQIEFSDTRPDFLVKPKRKSKPFYGESNPGYPGKWILISERPPLVKRTKRGKRKNRRGQIIDIKKPISNFKDNFYKPAKIIDYALLNDKNKPFTTDFIHEDHNSGNDQQDLEAKILKDLYPPSNTLNHHKNIISLDDLLLDPGRTNRPDKIVIILRGPPGSGKSFLAKLIKDQEEAISGVSPCIVNIDEYFLTCTDEKSTNVPSYNYDPFREREYLNALIKKYKSVIQEGAHSFVIVDSWNDNLSDYEMFYNTAKQHGYAPYTIELLYDLEICMKHNVHARLSYDIRTMINKWINIPQDHILLDATNLIQFSMDPQKKCSDKH